MTEILSKKDVTSQVMHTSGDALILQTGGPRSAVGTAPDSYVRGPGFDTYILSFFFRYFKRGSCQLLAKVCARSTG